MNCKEVRGRMSDFLDADILERLCEELKAHLAECENCRVEVNTLQRTIELSHRIPSREVPGGVEERLFRVLSMNLTKSRTGPESGSL